MFRLKPITHAVLRALVGAAAGGVPLAAFAQSPAQPEPTTLEEVVVTGSFIPRATDEGALPITVVTAEQIAKTGAQTTEQLLQTITSATQGNSNTVMASVSGVNSAGVAGASLRGLGSVRTLVLINGRRSSAGGTLTDSTTVDINSIPIAAVERVEVLKDGASAIYGSDAIAGVINFILKKNYQGGGLSLNMGASDQGGAGSKRATASFGFGNLEDDRFNILFVANHVRENPLFGRQRDFADSAIDEIHGTDGTSGNAFPANIVIPNVVVNGMTGPVTVNPRAPNCAPAVVDPNFGDSVCRYDPSREVSLLPKVERSNIYGALQFAFTDDVTGYAEASFGHNRMNTVIQAAPVSDQFGLPATHPLFNQAPYNGFATVVLRPTSTFYPTAYIQGITGGATPDVLVRYRTVEIGNRDFTDTSDQLRFALGTQGKIGGWQFDAPLLFAQTEMTERINGGISLYTRLLPLLNSGTVNFFGENTAEIKAQLAATQFIGDAYTTKSSITSFAPHVSRELFELPAGPVAMAFGVEGRREKFETRIAPELQLGDTTQYGGSNLPVDVSRDVTSVFAEFRVPVLESLNLSAAVRRDRYEGTGSKTVPKFTLEWRPLDELLLRGSYGKGFRAPSLTELYQPQITGVSSTGLNDPARCGPGRPNDSRDCLTQFNILLGGNPELKPETSDNFTLGVVVEPLEGLSVGIDAFKVDLQNTIIAGITPEEILGDPQFADFVVREPDSDGLPGHISQINQLNLNFGETRVTGADLDVRYRLPEMAIGRFTLNANGTYFKKFDIQNLDGSFQSVRGAVSPITNGVGGAIPKWHHYLSLGWDFREVNVTLAQNYQASYRDLESNVTQVPRTVEAYVTHDLQASYTMREKLQFSLGVKNLLDEDPPYTNAAVVNYFQAGYDPGYADPRGRFFYGVVSYSFE